MAIIENGIVIKRELGTGFTFDEANKKINVDFSGIQADIAEVVETVANTTKATEEATKAATKAATDGNITSGALNGSNLELTKADGSKVSIPLADIVPASKADHVVKSISYDSATKELVLTVGNDLDTNTTEIRASVSDLIPVTAGTGLEGNGTAEAPLTVKLAKDSLLKVDSNGVKVDLDKLQGAIGLPYANVHLQSTFGESLGYAFRADQRQEEAPPVVIDEE